MLTPLLAEASKETDVIRRPNRKYNLSPSRRTIGRGGAANQIAQPTQIVPTSFVHSSSTLVVTFPQAVIYSGTLPLWTNNSQHVIGVTQTTATVFTLTFSGATAAGAVLIPFQDPAFRSDSGGFVQAGSYTAT